MSYFYSHIIEIESVILKLEEMGLPNEQKIQLAQLIDSTIHQTILDIIFSKLSDEDKKIFIEKLQEDPQDKKLMEFLNSKIENVEDEIKEAIAQLKEELHQDIEKVKKEGK